MHVGTQPPQGDVRPSTGDITRIASADAQQALERIQASSILDEGRVCLMSLDAIRERLGPRGMARRDRVYAHRHQSLSRALGSHWRANQRRLGTTFVAAAMAPD
jgi:hypothetical protein